MNELMGFFLFGYWGHYYGGVGSNGVRLCSCLKDEILEWPSLCGLLDESEFFEYQLKNELLVYRVLVSGWDDMNALMSHVVHPPPCQRAVSLER